MTSMTRTTETQAIIGMDLNIPITPLRASQARMEPIQKPTSIRRPTMAVAMLMS
jgi:hypothetical protein